MWRHRSSPPSLFCPFLYWGREGTDRKATAFERILRSRRNEIASGLRENFKTLPGYDAGRQQRRRAACTSVKPAYIFCFVVVVTEMHLHVIRYSKRDAFDEPSR